MNDRKVNKEGWVAMFREIGLDENQMRRWHAAFEQRHPESHAEFLAWLKIPQTEIDSIRAASKGEWAKG